MHYVAAFFAGAFLCNSVPHLVAKPHGVGDSSALVNFVWGFFNLLVGLYLFSRHPVLLEFTPDLIVPLAGALAIGLYMSVHFGKVWQDKHVRRT
jgi:peptidoglycan/LPS O-acetylase OafA/YrhL